MKGNRGSEDDFSSLCKWDRVATQRPHDESELERKGYEEGRREGGGRSPEMDQGHLPEETRKKKILAVHTEIGGRERIGKKIIRRGRVRTKTSALRVHSGRGTGQTTRTEPREFKASKVIKGEWTTGLGGEKDRRQKKGNHERTPIGDHLNREGRHKGGED